MPLPLIESEVRRRRTFAIISHPDAGKTTLTEKLLLFGGAIQLAGAVKGRKATRHATSDWMQVEQQRGISVTSSVMQFEYEGYIINLLDTPGHEDFSEDTYRVLTAVDSAVMVIDAAKGVEAQTIKLLNVCRMRNTPIITFINKMDREVRDPLDLLDEIESVLHLSCVPITWPIGMGKSFRGVFSLLKNHLVRFAPGQDHLGGQTELIEGLDNPRLDALYPMEIGQVRDSVELIQGASEAFDLEKFLHAEQSPVFFGSGINNFGVKDVLEALVQWAPAPLGRDAGTRRVEPTEADFTGFVFKIQANMDPRHRDRIAFLRVCSGKYEPGMKVEHVRLEREMKIQNALTFMANERIHMQHAYAGDIIGIYNHGQLHIGDTLTCGEKLGFTGIPYFAPELFRSARAKDPLKGKQLHQGLKELGEEGAIQVFEGEFGNLMLGAVGPLQFVIVAQRLATEYRVDAIYEATDVSTARWLVFPDEETRKQFCTEQASRLAKDSEGNTCYMATSIYNLQTTMKHWPQVQFRTTREQGQKFD